METKQDLSVRPDFPDNLLLRFLVSPRYRIARHLLLILAIGTLFTDAPREYKGNLDILIGACGFLFIMGVLYLNMYFFIPRYLFRNKHLQYFVVIFLQICICFVFLLWLNGRLQAYRLVPKPNGESLLKGFFGFAFVMGLIIAASTAIRLFQRWVTDTWRIRELERNTWQAELGLLKSQVNPHFLFNTLNNANVLIHKDPAKASQMLLSLSELLRYQLYDSAGDQTLLSADIRFLRDFLQLEKERRDQFLFEIRTEGDWQDKRVPPFLFIPFVENAVKHSRDPEHSSWVRIKFAVSGKMLTFECVNSKTALPGPGLPGAGGIGLGNIRRRLELLYGEQHQLRIREDAQVWSVHLNLPV